MVGKCKDCGSEERVRNGVVHGKQRSAIPGEKSRNSLINKEKRFQSLRKTFLITVTP